jgi:hypothetical protein
MKKIVYTICLAALAIACSKTEVQFEQTDAISFAPVAQVATKAAVQSGAPGCALIVSAFAGTGSDQTAYTEAYFKNVEFADPDKNGVFEASGYFWPNVKKLTFAGVTKSAGFADGTSVSIYDATNTVEADRNKIVIYNYEQPEAGAANNDLMWFDRTIPAGKPTASNYAENVSLKHSCSWIVLNFYGDATSGGTRPWKITNVTINGLAVTGKAELTSTATWPASGLGAKTKALVVYAQGTKENGLGAAIDTDFIPLPDGIIVIPQEPTTISVTYNYLSQGANTTETTDDIRIEETATVSLEYNGTTAWAPGTKYTYDIQLTATGIKIAPTASTWVVYDNDGNAGNKDNIPGTI